MPDEVEQYPEIIYQKCRVGTSTWITINSENLKYDILTKDMRSINFLFKR